MSSSSDDRKPEPRGAVVVVDGGVTEVDDNNTNANNSSSSSSKSDIANRVIKRVFPPGFAQETMIICRNAIPLAIGNLSQMLFTMMSLFFCGHIGSNELAAVALANTVRKFKIYTQTNRFRFGFYFN